MQLRKATFSGLHRTAMCFDAAISTDEVGIGSPDASTGALLADIPACGAAGLEGFSPWRSEEVGDGDGEDCGGRRTEDGRGRRRRSRWPVVSWAFCTVAIEENELGLIWAKPSGLIFLYYSGPQSYAKYYAFSPHAHFTATPAARRRRRRSRAASVVLASAAPPLRCRLVAVAGGARRLTSSPSPVPHLRLC